MNTLDKNIDFDVTEKDWEDFWYGEDDDTLPTDNESERE